MEMTLTMGRTLLKIFSRDRQAIFFTLFFPITFMVIFGIASTGADDPIEIGIVDNAANQFSARFIETLESRELFDVNVGAEEELRARVVDGDLALALILPERFDGSDTADLTMLVDAAQVRQSAMLTPLVEQALLDVERELRGIEPLFPLSVVDVQARSQRYIDFLVPGLLALTIMQISVAGSGFNIVEYRRKGILKRLFVTPIRSGQFIGGLVLSRLLITVIQVSVLLAVAVVLLDVPVEGNVLELLALIVLGSSIFLSLGFWMGSLAKTQQAIMLLGNLITLPQMFLSGVFFSIEAMPELLQPIAKLLPLSFVVSSVREVILDGTSIAEQIPTLIGLLAWLAIGLTLAIRFFRWKEVAT
ncbi:MAG TPA: ABC transporter permease [Gammaproteobacteria bacterium]|nr:ABC transporter permease [Gammaproteobacteria bacterium]